MRKFIAAIVLAMLLVLTPTPADAVCVKVEVVAGQPICIDTGVPALDRPSIDVPVPTVPPIVIDPPPIVVNPPGNGNGGSGGSQGGSGGSGGSGGNGGSPEFNEPFLPGDPVSRNDVGDGPQPENPQGSGSENDPVTVEDGVPDDPSTIYRIRDYPWYVWVTIIVAGIGIGFMLFFDSEKPKRSRGRHSA